MTRLRCTVPEATGGRVRPMRPLLSLLAAAAFIAPAAAHADQPTAFGKIPCVAQSDGTRFCQGTVATRVASFDGQPIDVERLAPEDRRSRAADPRPARLRRFEEGLRRAGGAVPAECAPARLARLRGPEHERPRLRGLVRLARLAHAARLRKGLDPPARHALRGPGLPVPGRTARRSGPRAADEDRRDRRVLRRRQLDHARHAARTGSCCPTARSRRGRARTARRWRSPRPRRRSRGAT